MSDGRSLIMGVSGTEERRRRLGRSQRRAGQRINDLPSMSRIGGRPWVVSFYFYIYPIGTSAILTLSRLWYIVTNLLQTN